MPPKRFKKIDKAFEKMISNVEIESSENENDNENDNQNYNETNDNLYIDKDYEIDKIKNESDYIFEKIYNISKYLIYLFKFIFSVSGIYLAWICLHYFSSHLYVKMCVPSTVIGFIMSPFMTATPHCQGLRWVVYNAANAINNMWVVFGTWICSTILNFNTYKEQHISS